MEPLRPARRRRHPSLTPMIDVVFLLLVFFMLAARFGNDRALPLPLPLAGSGAGYQGPPRLVEILPEAVLLNGRAIGLDALPGALAALMATPGDAIVLQGRDGADLQRVIDVARHLTAAGLPSLVLVE